MSTDFSPENLFIFDIEVTNTSRVSDDLINIEFHVEGGTFIPNYFNEIERSIPDEPTKGWLSSLHLKNFQPVVGGGFRRSEEWLDEQGGRYEFNYLHSSARALATDESLVVKTNGRKAELQITINSKRLPEPLNFRKALDLTDKS